MSVEERPTPHGVELSDHVVHRPCEPRTPALAREWVRRRLPQLLALLGQDGSTPRALLDDALLVTSELVTNAVRAGADEITVALSVDGVCRVGVTDNAGGDPVVSRARPLDTSGRGLFIVAAVAADWGVTDVRSGKEVWAEFPLPS